MLTPLVRPNKLDIYWHSHSLLGCWLMLPLPSGKVEVGRIREVWVQRRENRSGWRSISLFVFSSCSTGQKLGSHMSPSPLPGMFHMHLKFHQWFEFTWYWQVERWQEPFCFFLWKSGVVLPDRSYLAAWALISSSPQAHRGSPEDPQQLSTCSWFRAASLLNFLMANPKVKVVSNFPFFRFQWFYQHLNPSV